MVRAFRLEGRELAEYLRGRHTVLRKELLGRANAAIHVVTASLLPVGSLCAGLLADLVEDRGDVARLDGADHAGISAARGPAIELISGVSCSKPSTATPAVGMPR